MDTGVTLMVPYRYGKEMPSVQGIPPSRDYLNRCDQEPKPNRAVNKPGF